MLKNKLLSAMGGAPANYIEDVFSTYLYTGNGSTQTITNGIDLAGKGGLVWLKNRSAAASNNLYDTNRGTDLAIQTNSTAAQVSTATYGVDQYLNAGFVVGGSSNNKWSNYSGDNYVSWTFRKQPKFFDVETYTGNAGTLSVSHALGAKPGCIIIKSINPSSDWLVITRKSDGNIYAMYLNDTIGQFYDGTEGSLWTSTSVSINWLTSNVSGGYNDNGTQYVMYLFAHNAGGFGLSGTDNVISCGSYTGNGTTVGPDVNLGYEPQFLMVKNTSAAGSWFMWDSMRGITADGTTQNLTANSTSAENTSTSAMSINATGFSPRSLVFSGSGSTYIYIAIRRGPMKVPTSGTSVFNATTNKPTSGLWGATNLVDFALAKWRYGDQYWSAYDRLRGYNPYLETNSSVAEASYGNTQAFARNADWYTASLFGANIYSGYFFSRAPGYMDVCCYSGNDTAGATQAHNLGVAPEFMIVKRRNQADGWFCYHSALGATKYIPLNDYQPATTTSSIWDNTAPTASVFTLGWNSAVNGSGSTYVAYLFSTLAGVSKVGSYTGTGTTLQVNCGFTSGARFVLIKRTNGSGDSADGWYVWDSARGIVAGNDPYLLLNTTAAEVTSTDYIDTYSAGFEISSTAPAAINASGGTYIFLAIA